jgi:hypothetical protein
VLGFFSIKSDAVIGFVIAGGLQMGYKRPCYSQPESLAAAASRAGSAAMAGFGTQLGFAGSCVIGMALMCM